MNIGFVRHYTFNTTTKPVRRNMSLLRTTWNEYSKGKRIPKFVMFSTSRFTASDIKAIFAQQSPRVRRMHLENISSADQPKTDFILILLHREVIPKIR